jgi:hypothetical protein
VKNWDKKAFVSIGAGNNTKELRHACSRWVMQAINASHFPGIVPGEQPQIFFKPPRFYFFIY